MYKRQYIGMWIGFLGVMLAIKDRYVGSLICLMLAGVCDMFDGTIASTKKDRTRDERTFGIQIDSISYASACFRQCGYFV